MKSDIELRPTYWASVSGGKDSFYMLYVILQNPDKYPLDGCVYYDLEIDYPFIKDVIGFIENMCKQHGITFFRIKPDHTWEYYYNRVYERGKRKGERYLYPTRVARWCNSEYKLSCEKKLDRMISEQGKRVVHYIGYCVDEPKRFKAELNSTDPKVTQIYPLAEMGIEEDTILQWAKQQPIYNDYYKYNKRCGCMGCPMTGLDTFVYFKMHYPEQFDYFMSKAKETEEYREKEYGRPFSVWGGCVKYNTDYKIRRVNEIIKMMELGGEQITMDEYFGPDISDEYRDDENEH